MSSLSPLRSVACALLMVVLAACSGPDSIVEPGPGNDEAATSEDPAVDLEDSPDSDDDASGDVETSNAGESETPTTSSPDADQAQDESASPEGQSERPEVFILDEDSENAAVFSELADSGLALTIEEQACADQAASSAIGTGSSELDAVIDAVRSCAAPVAIDDFASELIIAGGAGLPPDEAACVSSLLQSGDEYQPFWAALLEEEQFDFLLSELEVQNRYLDLYSECVSVGRAVGEQAAVTLSAPSVGCIDDLYQDREFVRVTIEADLSGNAEELNRIADQIRTCLTTEEQALLN